MPDLALALLTALLSALKSRRDLILENLALRHQLAKYFDYYHWTRTHLSLGKDSPRPWPVHRPSAGEIVELPEVGGLHHRYERRTT